MQDDVQRYIELGLRLGKHADELVDSFYGSDELAQRVEAEEPRDPAALVEDAEALLADVGEPWLEAQVRAIWANARKRSCAGPFACWSWNCAIDPTNFTM